MPKAAGDRMLLMVEVEDTGIGIAPENQERIFTPFVQLAKTAPQHDGTGLGLSITRQFVETMGGTITVQSTTGGRLAIPNRITGGVRRRIRRARRDW